MKTLTIKVPDNKYSFFVELIKNLGFAKQVEVEDIDIDLDKAEILNGIREAVDEVNLIKQGKKKSVPLKDFLNEL
jgi:hypothetical protein